MKPKGIIPGITALCAILGMLIGVQYNTDNVRLTELSAELRKEREEKEALEKQLDKQAELLETYEAGESDGAALESLQKEKDALFSTLEFGVEDEGDKKKGKFKRR